MSIRPTVVGLMLPIVSLAACHHVPRGCDPTPTPAHSALAWGPAERDSSDVRGLVIAAQTGDPLDGADVAIEPGHYRALTDREGRFRIPGMPGGHYYVHIRRVGYEDVRDSVTYGMGGLRMFAALAHDIGIVDFVCTATR